MFYGAIIAALVPLMTTAFPLEERQTPSTTSALVAVPSQTSQIPNLYDPEGIATVDVRCILFYTRSHVPF